MEALYLSSHYHKGYPTIFDVLLGRFQKKALWVWIFFGLLGAGSTYLFYLKTELNQLLGTFVPLALGIAVVPIAFRIIYSILLNWMSTIPDFIKDGRARTSEIDAWVDDEFKNLAKARTPIIFASFYALAAIGAFTLGGAFELPTWRLLVPCFIIAFVGSFTCGVGLCAIVYLGRFIWRLGKYDVRVSDHGFGILSTGRTLLKCYAVIAVVWCVYTSSSSAWSLKQGWLPIFLLAVPAVVFFIGSYIICQIPLHNRMILAKRNELHRLENILARLAPETDDDLTEQRTEKIKFCISEVQRIKNLPEWPFGVSSISGVFMSSFLTIAPHVLKLVLSQLHITGK